MYTTTHCMMELIVQYLHYDIMYSKDVGASMKGRSTNLQYKVYPVQLNTSSHITHKLIMNINTQFDYYNMKQLLPCTVHDNSIQWYVHAVITCVGAMTPMRLSVHL